MEADVQTQLYPRKPGDKRWVLRSKAGNRLTNWPNARWRFKPRASTVAWATQGTWHGGQLCKCFIR